MNRFLRHENWAAALIAFGISISAFALFAVSSCSTPTVTPEPPVITNPPGNVISGAEQSCRSYRWKARGQLPGSTIDGIVTALKRTVCLKRAEVSQPVNATSGMDALSLYKLPPTAANVYALLLSSAAYESSGNVCEGRDTSAGAETSTTAESGLFQQSQNVTGLHPALKAIYDEYSSNPGYCAAWKTSCSQAGIVGTGAGADFQRLMRNCPMLATEQAAIGMRVGMRHWGPVRRGELELVPDCQKWFSAVEAGGCP